MSEKFIPKENIEPVCEICRGPHKTSHHHFEKIDKLADAYKNKTEKIHEGKEELVCEICGGPHKTSHHPFESKDKIK